MRFLRGAKAELFRNRVGTPAHPRPQGERGSARLARPTLHPKDAKEKFSAPAPFAELEHRLYDDTELIFLRQRR